MLLGAIALTSSSCGSSRPISQGAEKLFHWHPALSKNQEREVPFEFEVTPGEQAGTYQVRGTTALPEGSQLAIAALRYLKLDPDMVRSSVELEADRSNELNLQEVSTALLSEGSDFPEPTRIEPTGTDFSRQQRLALKPSYAILDYQPIEVREGQWQSELNLWQVARDGRYQESWQLHQEELALQWKAEPKVIFLATLLVDGAADRLQLLQNQLADDQLTLERTWLQTSAEGERYFQAVQLRSVPLPQAQTSPPPLRVQDINGGWGKRYLLVEQDPLPGTLTFPEQRHSDGPGSPREFIQ